MNAKITIEDYVAPAKEPHQYAPIIQQLVDAGSDKVATAAFDSEDEALAYVRAMQAAAREVNKSAMKRIFEKRDDGKFYAGVSVRDKITRTAKTETPAVEGDSEPAKKSGK